MKKILVAALAAIAVLTGTARAGGVLTHNQVPWRFPANVTTSPYLQATKASAAGGTDTTAWVGTDGWYMPDINSTDTVVVARFIVYLDSTAVYAPAQTTITAFIDGAVTPNGGLNITGGGYPQTNTFPVAETLTPTTGDKLMSFPVFITGANQFSPLGANWATIPPFIRLRFSSSAAVNAAACAIQFMKPVLDRNN